MIDKTEFDTILKELNEIISNDPEIYIPEIMEYDRSLDGIGGIDQICSLSPLRHSIVVNYDELCWMYPYMDDETIKKMLLSIIHRINNS